MLYQHGEEQFKQVRNQIQLEMESLNKQKKVETKFMVLKKTIWADHRGKIWYFKVNFVFKNIIWGIY